MRLLRFMLYNSLAVIIHTRAVTVFFYFPSFLPFFLYSSLRILNPFVWLPSSISHNTAATKSFSPLTSILHSPHFILSWYNKIFKLLPLRQHSKDTQHLRRGSSQQHQIAGQKSQYSLLQQQFSGLLLLLPPQRISAGVRCCTTVFLSKVTPDREVASRRAA